ncbi:MAG TPA: MFS transporter [Armatimonadota bacterium]|jgi:MFS family permease
MTGESDPRQPALAEESQAADTVAGHNYGPFSALRHRNYRLFWFGQLISVSGSWMQTVAQGWLIAKLAASSGANPEAATAWYLGLISACGNLPVLFGALLGGVVADRVDKRRLIIGTQAVMMITALVLSLLTATDVVRIWHVLVMAVVLGCATAFDLPARQAFIVDMVGKEDLGGAVALNSGLFNSARMIGPAITGALLAAHASLAVCFLANGLSFLAVIASLMMMEVPTHRVTVSDQHVIQTIREGLGYVRHTPAVRRVLIFVAAFGTFAFSFNVLLPAFVRFYLARNLANDFGLQGSKYGMLESVRGIGALAAALTAATLAKRRMQAKLIVFGAIGSTIGLIVFSMQRSLLPAYISIAFVSFFFVLCFASSQTLVQLEVPNHLRGRVMSIYVLLMTGLSPIGSLMAGSLAHTFNTPFAIRAGVILGIVLTGLGLGAELFHRRQGKMVGSSGA